MGDEHELPLLRPVDVPEGSHTPETQKPEAQSPATEHVDPLPRPVPVEVD